MLIDDSDMQNLSTYLLFSFKSLTSIQFYNRLFRFFWKLARTPSIFVNHSINIVILKFTTVYFYI